jgi:hypothetical protein
MLDEKLEPAIAKSMVKGSADPLNRLPLHALTLLFRSQEASLDQPEPVMSNS